MGRKNGKAGAPEGAPGGTKNGGRFSARRKAEAVLRLLRGEELDTLSRELGMTAATLSGWRDEFLRAGQTGLKSRKSSAWEERERDLLAKIGDLSMENEIFRQTFKVKGWTPPLLPPRRRTL